MDYNDPIDQDRMWFDSVEYGDQAQDAIDITDPFLTSLAVIGELAGMRALELVIDAIGEEVPNFSHDRILEMNDDYRVYYKRAMAERWARVGGRAA
jgi:hypothetical protein